MCQKYRKESQNGIFLDAQFEQGEAQICFRERERFSVVFFCILTTYTTKAKTNKQRINKEGELHFNLIFGKKNNNNNEAPFKKSSLFFDCMFF